MLKYAAVGPLAHARGSVTALDQTILLPSRDREGVACKSKWLIEVAVWRMTAGGFRPVGAADPGL